MMGAWPVRFAEAGAGVLRRRVVEAAFHGGDDGVVARAAAEVPGVPAADLLLCLVIDPDTALILGVRHLCHLIDKAVDIFSFASGVSTDINSFHIGTV